MEDKLKLEIVTPYGTVFDAEVDEVTALGSEGEFGVMPGHAPFVTTLSVGTLSCKQGGQSIYFFVNWGYADVGPDHVVVLADSAERSEDIDVDRAHEAQKRAEEILRQTKEVDFARAEAALQRALARLHVKDQNNK